MQVTTMKAMFPRHFYAISIKDFLIKVLRFIIASALKKAFV